MSRSHHPILFVVVGCFGKVHSVVQESLELTTILSPQYAEYSEYMLARANTPDYFILQKVTYALTSQLNVHV